LPAWYCLRSANDMKIVGAFIEGLSWCQRYLFSTLHLHHNGALQPRDSQHCLPFAESRSSETFGTPLKRVHTYRTSPGAIPNSSLSSRRSASSTLSPGRRGRMARPFLMHPRRVFHPQELRIEVSLPGKELVRGEPRY